MTNQKRRVAVSSVSRTLRDAKFRKNVLTAYSYRCAVCGLALSLTDAAHIVPVAHQSSVDKTCNGLALCALHHRAYDQSLVTVWEDYTVRVSEVEAAHLKAIARDDGIEAFRLGLYYYNRTWYPTSLEPVERRAPARPWKALRQAQRPCQKEVRL